MDRPYSKLEKVEYTKVFLATPMDKDSRIHGETSAFCSYMSGSPNVQWGYTRTGSPEMSRNTLIEDHFHLTDDWTHIFFLDTDVVPPPSCLASLLNLEADVCVGLYPLLLEDAFYWSAIDMDSCVIPMHRELPKVPFEILSAGAGCLLIRKEVLKDIDWPYFKTIYQKKWENDGEEIRYMEDMFFYGKVREAGYKIIADPNMVCKHFNSVDLLKAFNVAKNEQAEYRVKCPNTK